MAQDTTEGDDPRTSTVVDESPLLMVRTDGVRGGVRLWVGTDVDLPVRLTIRITSSSGDTVARSVVLRDAVSVRTLRLGVEGRVSWWASAPGVTPVTGAVRVLEPVRRPDRPAPPPASQPQSPPPVVPQQAPPATPSDPGPSLPVDPDDSDGPDVPVDPDDL